MIRALVVSPYAKDANSFHRCMGPWNYLAKHSRQTARDGKGISPAEDIQFSLAQDDIGTNGVAWDTVGQFDILFLHRPCRPDDLKFIQMARLMNVPVWSDYDDWLFEVPHWNPNKAYNNPDVQTVMAACIATSDVVSVTTGALYEKFCRINKNTVIVPNCYRGDLYPYRLPDPGKRKSAICWRGTNTHDEDLMSVAQGMANLPGNLTFYGGAPWMLLRTMKPGSFTMAGMSDPFLYMRRIYFDAPSVMVVPLVDCLFNRSKSNIAYMEALHAGALCVAPDLPEWQRPGVITYKPHDSESFLAAVSQVNAMSQEALAEQVKLAYDHMLELYDTAHVNQIRLQILNSMVAKDFERNQRDPFDQMTGIWALGKIKGSLSQAG